MDIIFFGSPEFAAKQLDCLASDTSINIKAVVTQPDKPVGRKQILLAPAVKLKAKELGIKVLQPNSKKELEAMLQGQKVDLFVVIAFGMILTKTILAIPKYGAINLHASLLPKYRGASPIQESLLNGDEDTGISIMKMDEELDHGPIYLIKRIEIEKNDTTEKLTKKMAILAANILVITLEDIINGTLRPIPQKHNNASFCRKITKDDGKIEWAKPAPEICNMVRAYNPWPIAFTVLNGKKIKIIEATFDEENQKGVNNGEFYTKDKILKIKTAKGNLLPINLQPEGKNPMNSKSFLNGYQKLIKEL